MDGRERVEGRGWRAVYRAASSRAALRTFGVCWRFFFRSSIDRPAMALNTCGHRSGREGGREGRREEGGAAADASAKRVAAKKKRWRMRRVQRPVAAEEVQHTTPHTHHTTKGRNPVSRCKGIGTLRLPSRLPSSRVSCRRPATPLLLAALRCNARQCNAMRCILSGPSWLSSWPQPPQCLSCGDGAKPCHSQQPMHRITATHAVAYANPRPTADEQPIDRRAGADVPEPSRAHDQNPPQTTNPCTLSLPFTRANAVRREQYLSPAQTLGLLLLGVQRAHFGADESQELHTRRSRRRG